MIDLSTEAFNWSNVIQAGFTAVVGAYAFLTRGAREAAKEAAMARQEVSDLKERVTRIETHIERLPDRELVRQMQVSLARLEATVEAKFETLSATVLRLQNYLERAK